MAHSRAEQWAATIRTPTPDVVCALNAARGATLVAMLAGVRDRKLPYKWAAEDGPIPRPDALRRLQCAHLTWLTVLSSDGPDIARAWFIGMNPDLDDQSAVEAIREGRLTDVVAAAEKFAREG